MPGQYAVRGGILDVYSPEADRPLRIEFFGDEADSIRKFDPASQRSSNPVDEALLLPLTETPVSEHLLGAIHTRLSGKRITGNEEIVEAAVRAGGVNVFPGWEFYSPVAGADSTIFDLIPRAAVLLDEPDQLQQEFDRFWTRVHEAPRAQRSRQSRSSRRSLPAARRLVAKNCQSPRRRYRAPRHHPQPGRRSQSLSSPSPRRASTAQFPPCLRRSPEAQRRRQARALRRPQHRRSRAPSRCFHRVQRLVSFRKPHSRRRELRRRDQLFRRRSPHHHAGHGLRPRRRPAPRGQSRRLRLPRSLRRIRRRSLASAALKIQSLRLPLRLPRSPGRRLRSPRRAWHRPVPGPERNQPRRRSRRIHAARIRRSRPPLRSADAS